MFYSDADPDPEGFGVPDALRLPRLPLRLRSEPLPECALPLRDRDRDEREPNSKLMKTCHLVLTSFLAHVSTQKKK